MKKWIPVWTIPVLILIAIGTVWIRLWIVRITYEINQADRVIQNTQQEIERLGVEIAQLRSPKRLEKIAREKFDLVPPKADQVVRFGKKNP